MLELLSLRKGTTLTKEMFLNHLYGGMDEPELKIIDVFICKLRKKLANASSGKNYIETSGAAATCCVSRARTRQKSPREFVRGPSDGKTPAGGFLREVSLSCPLGRNATARRRPQRDATRACRRSEQTAWATGHSAYRGRVSQPRP